MKPLLEVKNLVVSFKTYVGKICAVRNISFDAFAGETLAIVGESGCGKSTVAHALISLIAKPAGTIESGKILFQELDLCQLSKKEIEKIRGKEIGMIFQDPMTSLNPTMRVGYQIMESLIKHRGFSKKIAKQEALQLLKLVGIADAEKRLFQFPHEFSGGMRQRVNIAIALACDPKLLIADEPTTALDVTIQAQILDLMKEIQMRKKMSIIFITHDLGIVAGMCDKVLVMYAGQIVESGTVEEIYSNPRHPYTHGLLRSVPRLDMDRTKELIPIDGTPPNLFSSPVGCAFCPRCPYAMRICEKKSPNLESLDANHHVACWLKRKDEESIS